MVKLVAFTMDRCPHCVQLKNHLNEIDLEYTHYSVDTPEGQEKIEKWGVTNFPTLFFLDQSNKIIDIQVGFNPQEQNMREVLESYEARNR